MLQKGLRMSDITRSITESANGTFGVPMAPYSPVCRVLKNMGRPPMRPTSTTAVMDLLFLNLSFVAWKYLQATAPPGVDAEVGQIHHAAWKSDWHRMHHLHRMRDHGQRIGLGRLRLRLVEIDLLEP